MRSITRGTALVLAVLTGIVSAGFLYALWSGRTFAMNDANALRWSAMIDGTDTAKIIVTAAVGVLFLMPAILAIVSALSEPRMVSVRVGGMESAQLPERRLERHLKAAVLEVEQVEGADVDVKQRGNEDIAVALDLRIAPDADAGSVMMAAEQRVASALASPYGITLRQKPSVSIRHAERRQAKRKWNERKAA